MTATSGRGRRDAACEPTSGQPSNESGETSEPAVRYSESLAGKICEKLGEGATFSHLSTLPDMPSLATLYRWRKTKPKFELNVAVALSAGATRMAERALEIAEGATKETLPVDRLRVDVLMKHAAQMSPQEWGRGAKTAEKAKDRGDRKIVVRVRDFTPVTRPDGTVFTREILPNGSFRDFER